MGAITDREILWHTAGSQSERNLVYQWLCAPLWRNTVGWLVSSFSGNEKGTTYIAFARADCLTDAKVTNRRLARLAAQLHLKSHQPLSLTHSAASPLERG